LVLVMNVTLFTRIIWQINNQMKLQRKFYAHLMIDLI
jgi:hypothetical protein